MEKRSPAMRAWKENGQRSSVTYMPDGDFFSAEQSHVMPAAGKVTISLSGKALKEVALQEGEVIDATRLNKAALCEFFEKEIQDCFDNKLMMSLHMKATMMKVSDPIIFGHCVKIFYKDVFAKHADLFAELKVNANNGVGDVYDKIKGHAKEEEVKADILKQYETRPGLAMVDSNNGITNLHVPSDVIIDASMPNVVRDGGQMWNKDDKLEEVKCIIPDRSYATSYEAIIKDCQAHGQFDWKSTGHVSNVGLMAQKAEEYGSHDKTFEIPEAGEMTVTDESGSVIFKHNVEVGDIWRMCQTKDLPIQDWVKLAVTRARATGSKAIFWLNPDRAHDANLIGLANKYLKNHNTEGLDIEFMKPADAMTASCTRARAGLDTISCTGNVLRDYLTDLFPILELGTSAKMLSVVPLLNGGVLLETGAGGSAPKHVEQFVEENHLRWDSLGEYLATAISFQELGTRASNPKSTLLGDTLMNAVGKWFDERRTPGRKVKQIVKELIECQGNVVDIGGYYKPDPAKVDKAMRP